MAEFCAALGFDEWSVASAAEALRLKVQEKELNCKARPSPLFIQNADSFSTI